MKTRSDVPMSDEVSESKALKDEARRAKQAIAEWVAEFEAANGRPPTSDEKAPITHLYDTFRSASAKLKAIKSEASPKKKKNKAKAKKKKLGPIKEGNEEVQQSPPPQQQQHPHF